MSFDRVEASTNDIWTMRVLMRAYRGALDRASNAVSPTMIGPVILNIVVEMLSAAISYVAIRPTPGADDNRVIPAACHLAAVRVSTT